MKNNSLFKSYLMNPASSYKGGKSRHEVQSDKKIYKLSSNENILGPSPLAQKAIQDNIHLLHEYPERTGSSLQTALSDFYQGQLSPEQFITANSGIGILELITHAFLGEGYECILSKPAFEAYRQYSNNVGTTIVDIPLIEENFHLDITRILSAINENTRVIWICSPNNPTGTHIPYQQIETLLDQIPDHVVLVYDEVYFQFADAEDYHTALPYVLKGKNIIGVNSFSKAYGLAGLRIGYSYTTPAIANYINQLRRPFYLSTLALEAAKAALKDTDFLNRTVQLVQEGKKFLYPELDEVGIKYWKSQTNFILLKPTMKDVEFEQRMLEQGIMVRPVANFGAPGCVRVTIGDREANEAFINGLKNVMAVH